MRCEVRGESLGVKEASLVGVSLCEATMETVNEFVVLQAPARNGEEA